VFDFFVEHGLTPELLRASYRHQVGVLADAFDALDLPPEILDRDRRTPLDRIGGFLSLTGARAGEIRRRLLERGVFSDSRGSYLRLGPAPYLADLQLGEAMVILGDVARQVG
jgi:kynureninase